MSKTVYVVKVGTRDDFDLILCADEARAERELAAWMRSRWDEVIGDQMPDDDDEVIEQIGGQSSTFEEGEILEARSEGFEIWVAPAGVEGTSKAKSARAIHPRRRKPGGSSHDSISRRIERASARWSEVIPWGCSTSTAQSECP